MKGDWCKVREPFFNHLQTFSHKPVFLLYSNLLFLLSGALSG